MRARRRSKARRLAWCSSCDIRIDVEKYDKCPVCNGTLITTRAPQGNTGLNLAFTVFECDQCGTIFTLDDQPESCANCGKKHDAIDRQVEVRVAAFGKGLARLQERLEHAHVIPFTVRGSRLSEDNYVMRRSELLRQFLASGDTLISEMSNGDFNEPERVDTQDAWRNLQGLANSSLDLAIELKAQPPPPLSLAAHRELTRCALLFATANVEFLTALTAPNMSIVKSRARRGQEALDAAGESIGSLTRLVGTGDDWLASGRDLGSQIEQNRLAAVDVFVELRSIHMSDPVMLRPFMPIARLAGQTHDSSRRKLRVMAASQLLVGASNIRPPWINDYSAYRGQASRAWRQLISQHDRIPYVLGDLQEGQTNAIHTLLDIGTKLAEGPFRRYGSILVVAHKVITGTEQSLDEDSLRRNQSFTTVRRELNAAVPTLVEHVDDLLRHAEAHYDYDASDGSVVINHLPAHKNARERVASLSVEDLLDSVFNLSEVTCAMAIAALDWTSNISDVSARELIRRDWLTQ